MPYVDGLVARMWYLWLDSLNFTGVHCVCIHLNISSAYESMILLYRGIMTELGSRPPRSELESPVSYCQYRQGQVNANKVARTLT